MAQHAELVEFRVFTRTKEGAMYLREQLQKQYPDSQISAALPNERDPGFRFYMTLAVIVPEAS
ncbi:MAG TPA: hypothetical protein VK114_00965 [Nitrososphaerales archaeon]|nr:hypothetical protein [Nitrososphaerales archaeon]